MSADKIIIDDQTRGDVKITIERTPVHEPVVESRFGLPPTAQQKLNARRRVRAKREARNFGRAAFQRLSLSERKQMRTLAAILRAAGVSNDTKAHRQIGRAFVDGFLAAAYEDERNPEATPATEAKKSRRVKRGA